MEVEIRFIGDCGFYFLFFFSLIWLTFPLCNGFSQTNKHGYNYIRPSMPQNCINCQKTSPMFMYFNCFLYYLNHVNINQPNYANSRVSYLVHKRRYLYANVWHSSIIIMQFFDKNILLMKHWKCKVCSHFGSSNAKPEDTFFFFLFFFFIQPMVEY